MVDPKQFAEAIWSGDLHAVVLMLDAGADPNATYEEHRWPPLHLAIEQQRTEIASKLLGAGAAINEYVGQGWTPLAHAIDIESDAASQAGLSPDEVSTELVELLLAAGAKPTERAFELARAYNNHKAMLLLQQALG